MCRIVSYLGPPARLSALLTEPPHGLVRQSHSPRLMTSGTLNADGWGVGWFSPDLGPRPGMIRGIMPIWSDGNVAGASHAIASRSIVAAVRAASPDMPVAESNTPPYLFNNHLFAHNGLARPWHGGVAREVRGRLGPGEEACLRGTTDSEFLGALWLGQMRRGTARDPGAALGAALREVAAIALELGGGLSATIIAAGPDEHLAARFAEPGPVPSLFVARDARRWPGATLIASEPLDEDEAWREVPPATLVRVDARGIRFEPIAMTREA